MTLRFKVSISGLNKVVTSFETLTYEMPATADLIALQVATRIENKAKRNLARGIQYKRHSPGLVAGTFSKRINEGHWRVKSQAFDEKGRDYAPSVEYGTRPHSSQSFKKIPIQLRAGWAGNVGPDFITHPGTYKSRTIGYFRGAVNEVKQEVRELADQVIGKSVRRSGFL